MLLGNKKQPFCYIATINCAIIYVVDLNSIYNKCLINILMYEDATLLLQAEKLGEKYSLNIHPYMKSALELLNKDI